MIKRVINVINRIGDGILAVCLISALMWGGLVAVSLVFGGELWHGIAFGVLFAIAFASGVMKGE